jgi:hypothetical protein
VSRYALLLAFTFASVALVEDGPPPREVPDAKKEPAKDDENAPKDDVQQTAERIAENAKKAGERLKDKDPGADTRKIQDEIVKDIDSLIKKAQEPPSMNPDMNPMMPPPKSDMMPPPMGGMPPPGGPMPKSGMRDGSGSKSPMGSGGTGGTPKPKVGPGSGSGRKPRPERKPRGDSPMGMGDPMANAGPNGMKPMPASPDPKAEAKNEDKEKKGENGGDRFGKASPKRENDKMAELYKDVWGHLPDRMRQEMDLYYREQFMPRYSELLRQYYAALAEQRKKGPEDR